jgi:hypothetical protein
MTARWCFSSRLHGVTFHKTDFLIHCCENRKCRIYVNRTPTKMCDVQPVNQNESSFVRGSKRKHANG